MPLSTAQQLQTYGVPTRLAMELQRQLFTATGNQRRLQELSMTPLEAKQVAAGITGNALNIRTITEQGMDSVVAKALWRLITGARNTALPAVTGTAQVGQTLTTTNGTWLNSPTFTRQWYANGVAIAGATALTYVVQAADVGKTINVVVSGTSTNGKNTATSNSTAAVVA